MKYAYCTLFDSHYLTRGIAMLKSLQEHCKDYHLFILAVDEIAYFILSSLQFPHTTIISMQEFENEQLLAVKSTRTQGEYCWTCTPSIIQYCIQTYNLPQCTYLDADLYFFDNPNQLIDEMGESSILLTKHHYTPRYNQEKTSGIFCVQFMTFKSDTRGLLALQWWKDRCLEWCFARFEDGKFGDQKYLDDWPTRFKGIHILQNKCGGLAPWNIQQFSTLSPIFYHFHHLHFIGENKVDFGPYFLPRITLKKIYYPYLKTLIDLRQQFLPNNFDGAKLPKWTWKTPLRYIKRRMLRSYNMYCVNQFLKAHDGKMD